MRAHLVQIDMAWESPVENFETVEALLATADIAPHDLILLPEMFATGFSLRTEATADKDGHTLDFLARLARSRRCYVQGGRTVHPDGAARAHNRMSIVGPDGALAREYSKIHPFSFGREPERFEGGGEVVTWDWLGPDGQGLRVCPSVCYDLRFPELYRIGALLGAEVFALGACWPAARREHWRALAIARAIENQAIVLAANRTGDDPHLSYAGGTIAVDAKGAVLGELGPEPGVLSVEADPQPLREWREAFPALRDVRLHDLRSAEPG
jgi:omega-amidase